MRQYFFIIVQMKQHTKLTSQTHERDMQMNNIKQPSNQIEQIKLKIKANLTNIEARTDITDDEKANQLIHLCAATCAGVAIQPIPFADIFLLAPIQGYLAERLSAVRGVPLTEAESHEVISELLKILGLSVLAQQTALGLYKAGLPGLAGFTTIPLVYGLTFGIGKLLDSMFTAKANGKKLSADDIKAMWKAAAKERKQAGKKFFKQHKNSKGS